MTTSYLTDFSSCSDIEIGTYIHQTFPETVRYFYVKCCKTYTFPFDNQSVNHALSIITQNKNVVNLSLKCVFLSTFVNYIVTIVKNNSNVLKNIQFGNDICYRPDIVKIITDELIMCNNIASISITTDQVSDCYFPIFDMFTSHTNLKLFIDLAKVNNSTFIDNISSSNICDLKLKFSVNTFLRYIKNISNMQNLKKLHFAIENVSVIDQSIINNILTVINNSTVENLHIVFLSRRCKKFKLNITTETLGFYLMKSNIKKLKILQKTSKGEFLNILSNEQSEIISMMCNNDTDANIDNDIISLLHECKYDTNNG